MRPCPARPTDYLACSQFHCTQECQARRNPPTLLPRHAQGQRQKLGLPSRHPLRAHYNALVDQVNAELKRFIAFFPKCVYWKHRGMISDYISLLSDDGVRISAAGERYIIAPFGGLLSTSPSVFE